MSDVFSSEKRSWIMSRVRSKDTSAEIEVRSLAHRLGFRFRIHRTDLPGKPDLVFSSRKKVIFVHGCFWHGHACPRGKRSPKANADYWKQKIEKNTERDLKAQSALKALGWDVLVVWECHLKEPERVAADILEYLTR